MKDLMIVMPWYGRLPNYFKFYIDSIRNVSFDTLLVSDCDFTGLDVPSNVRLLHMPMREFAERASKKLDVSAELDKPYKVCDFRPMFGRIFEDYLDGYMYWGYGDTDLIYGRKLDEYVEMVVSGGYDVASMHRQYLSGPFAMIKNDEKGRGLYRGSKEWRKVVTSKTHYQFEECGKNVDWPKLEFGTVSIEEYGKIFDSFSSALHREEGNGNIRYFHEDLITEHISRNDTVFKKGNGVFLNDEEIYIFHSLFVKGHRYFNVPSDDLNEFENYAITTTGYYTPKTIPWRGIIGKLRMSRAILEALKANGVSRMYSWFKLGR